MKRFLVTQKGTHPPRESGISPETYASERYRWRGRSAQDGKVVPNTLASGLDDYPRSAYPHEMEAHVDLHCWLVKAAQVMSRLDEITGYDSGTRSASGSRDVGKTYAALQQDLLTSLDQIHWHHLQGAAGRYADIGVAGAAGQDVRARIYSVDFVMLYISIVHEHTSCAYFELIMSSDFFFAGACTRHSHSLRFESFRRRPQRHFGAFGGDTG